MSDLPVKDLRRLLGVEDEAGVVPPQHGHDAQAQAGGVAAHQTGRLEQQLGFHQTQLIQKLQDHQQQHPFIHKVTAWKDAPANKPGPTHTPEWRSLWGHWCWASTPWGRRWTGCAGPAAGGRTSLRQSWWSAPAHFWTPAHTKSHNYQEDNLHNFKPRWAFTKVLLFNTGPSGMDTLAFP